MLQMTVSKKRSTVRSVNTQRRHDKVRAEFRKLMNENKYKQAYIIKTLSERYDLAERTVEDIVYCS